MLKAAEKKARTREKHQRKRYLHDHQRVPQSESPDTAEDGGLILECCHQVRTRGAQGWSQSEQHTRQDGKGRCEGQNAQVDIEVKHNRERQRQLEAGNRARRNYRQAETQHRTAERKQDAFREQLSQQPAAAGAHRQADSDLPLPRRGARQQQVRDVRAGHQQHEADHHHQDSHQAGRRRLGAGEQPARGVEGDGTLVFLLVLAIGVVNSLLYNVDRRHRLRATHTGPQTGVEDQPRSVPSGARLVLGEVGHNLFGHRQWHPELRHEAAVRAREAGRSHTHHRIALSVQDHRAADDACV